MHLFPEEKAVPKGVRQLFANGPDNAMILPNIVTGAKAWEEYRKEFGKLDAYIRDDGWILLVRSAITEAAEQRWLTNWVGKITLGSCLGVLGDSTELSEVFVYTESRVLYSIGPVDSNGNPVDMKHKTAQLGTIVESPAKAQEDLQIRDVGDLRDWLRRGCPR